MLDKITYSKYKRIRVAGYVRLCLYSNPSNCKICTFDGVGYCLNRYEKETIKTIKNYTYKFFFVHVNKKKYIETLQKHFNLVYCVSVPIGYSKKHQYHALFEGRKNEYSGRIKKEKATVQLDISDEVLEKIMSYKSKYWLKRYIMGTPIKRISELPK